jgi:hypothetical protein
MSERFMAKVSPEPISGCWLWTAHCNRGGYGVHSVGKKLILAHRFSWEMRHGPIEEGKYVLHFCDQPSCVNPDHLWLGTKAENNRDRAIKGRSSRGAHRNTSKLSETQALEIRRRALAGETLASLGREFGVTWQTVQGIRNGKYWHWLPDIERGAA